MAAKEAFIQGERRVKVKEAQSKNRCFTVKVCRCQHGHLGVLEFSVRGICGFTLMWPMRNLVIIISSDRFN